MVESEAKYKHHLKKVKKEKEALEAKKGELQCRLEEACSKAEAKAVAGVEKTTKAEQYCRGHEDRTEFFLELLAPDAFHQEGYFGAYVKYVEDCRQAPAEGQNPELVDFIPPATDEDDLGVEETTPFLWWGYDF